MADVRRAAGLTNALAGARIHDISQQKERRRKLLCLEGYTVKNGLI